MKRQLVSKAIASLMAGLLFAPAAAIAENDTANAVAGTLAASAITGIICWTMTQDRDDKDDEEEGFANEDYARHGFHLAIAASSGYPAFEGDVESDVQSDVGSGVAFDIDDASGGIRGMLGYRCHSRFSAEVQVEWLDSFEGDVTGTDGSTIGSLEFEPVVVTVNAKGYLLTGEYQPFVLLGAGTLTLESTADDKGGLGENGSIRDNSFVMRFGGGVDFYATENIAVTLQGDYVVPFGGLSNYDYGTLAIGVMYRF